jgi:hypothetical protein
MHPTGSSPVSVVELPDKPLFTVEFSIENSTLTDDAPLPQSAEEGPKQPARAMQATKHKASELRRMNP